MEWIVFGAGAQGRITLEILRAGPQVFGFWLADDREELHGQEVAGISVVGRGELAPLCNRGQVSTIVAIGHTPMRLRAARELASMGLRFGNAIHPSAVISPSARLGHGIAICPQGVVWTGAAIGDHAIINTGAVVEHDCVLEEGVSLAPGVQLAGRVRVGHGALIGAGATINPRITIGAGAIIGAGSIVTRSIGPDVVAYGVPAREIRPVDVDRDWQKLL